MRENAPLPDAILNAPELTNGLAFYLSSWQELGYDRPTGFGAGPIPSRSIREYADYMELDCDDRFIFEHIIRAIDRFFLERSNKEKK